MIGAIAKQVIGLFVDDELLAVGILVVVAAVALLTWIGAAPAWLAGLLLTVLLPATLAASVLRSVGRPRGADPSQ
jgi:hypothetical protein